MKLSCKAIAMLGSQLVAQSHGTGANDTGAKERIATRAAEPPTLNASLRPACFLADEHEHDARILAIVAFFATMSVKYPQIAVDLGRHFGGFLFSTAKVRMPRCASMIGAFCSSAL